MDVDVAVAAGLFADPTRAAIVAALLDGRASTAGELARTSGVSAPTVSSHLHRLLDAGMIAVEAQGRHRYYRLADERAARAFEALAALAPIRPVRSLRESRTAVELRWARTCYDHLAGTVAVTLADALLANRTLVGVGGRYQLGPGPSATLAELGIDLDAAARTRRSFAHPCLDWSERRHHVAGALGAALLTRMVDLGWVSRHSSTRAVIVHSSGRRGLRELLGCELPEMPATAPAA
ncbi:MAG: ArsR/SmtB family transcription factor [Acidimicrobiales bacterium]